MKYAGKYICSIDCPECEGEGRVVVGEQTSFNASKMEFDLADETAPCLNAYWDEPDYCA